jgi:hypothetical protein
MSIPKITEMSEVPVIQKSDNFHLRHGYDRVHEGLKHIYRHRENYLRGNHKVPLLSHVWERSSDWDPSSEHKAAQVCVGQQQQNVQVEVVNDENGHSFCS